MRRQSKSILTVLSLFFPIAAVACGGFDSSDTPSNGGPAVGLPQDKKDASQKGEQKEPPPPPPAPLPGTPTEDMITEQYGVFVAPTAAKPDADGSRGKPLSTITKAIAEGKKTSKHVYVCEGTFTESLTVERGISIIGGFDCSAPVWKKISNKTTRINAPSSPAMKATNIDIPTRVESLELYAANGTAAATTSIGLHAKGSSKLTIVSSKIVAGSGANGADGAAAIQLTLGASASGKPGQDRRYLSAIEAPDFRFGGQGGIGACIGADGFNGQTGGYGGNGGTFHCPNGQTTAMSLRNGFGQLAITMPTLGDVKSPAAGANGVNGSNGTVGVVTADGFVTSDGTSATNGSPGFGGSGGDGEFPEPFCSSPFYSRSGAGGGAGGCPGLAGGPGKGGGASIGVLMAASGGLTFDATEIVAGNAGAGGAGSLGSSPTAGGAAGGGFGAQAGGPGGNAGASGSGAGGSSFGIAYIDGLPNLLNGAAAKPGQAGPGAPALGARAASSAGEAKDVRAF